MTNALSRLPLKTLQDARAEAASNGNYTLSWAIDLMISTKIALDAAGIKQSEGYLFDALKDKRGG